MYINSICKLVTVFVREGVASTRGVKTAFIESTEAKLNKDALKRR